MQAAELREQLKNVHVYATSPFEKDDLFALDLDGLARNLEFLIASGLKVINVGGGTGEAEALAPEEFEALAQVGLEVSGGRALIIPTLPGNLAVARGLIPHYERLGARVVLAMPPLIRNQTPEDLEGVFAYYARLGEAGNLALMPYNTQAWTADFLVRLAEIETIIGIKDPCYDPHPLFRAIRRLGDRFVWIGNKRHDPGVLHFRYQAGIEGFTSGFVNFAPEYELELHWAALRQDWPRMVEIQEQLAPLERLRLAHGDAMLKAALDLIGLVGGKVRPPRRDLSPEVRAAVGAELRRLGLEVR